jgi:hypothetical protein
VTVSQRTAARLTGFNSQLPISGRVPKAMSEKNSNGKKAHEIERMKKGMLDDVFIYCSPTAA